MTSPARRSLALARGRRAAVVAVRSLSLVSSRAAARVLDPVSVSSWLLRGAPDPVAAAKRSGPRIDALIHPEPVDIVANYLRGRVLFGLPGRTDVRFEYHWDPARGVIDEHSKHVPKRIRSIQQRAGFEVRYDQDFESVIEASRREEYTWITDDVKAVYLRLFELGFVSSIAVYQDGALVGGLWGLEVGSSFGLMSVFHRVDNAGSMALIAMVDQVGEGLRWDLVDVGLVKPSFERFGAYPVPADDFTSRLLQGLHRVG